MKHQFPKRDVDLGSVRAALFDWAGTTIDYGSLAPVAAFTEAFARCGIEVTESEVREPMGKAKLDHLRSMLAMPRIAARWSELNHREPCDADALALYERFLSLQKEVLAMHATPIPGVVDAVNWCRSRGIRIGSTTGYTRELMAVLMPIAASHGYEPEVTLCSDEAAEGRPAPWLIYRAAEKLGVYPMQHIVIVDDSIAGIEAGRHAGCISIAVSKTGNALGLSEDAVAVLPIDELEQKLQDIRKSFLDAGADFVIESAAELPSLLSTGVNA